MSDDKTARNDSNTPNDSETISTERRTFLKLAGFALGAAVLSGAALTGAASAQREEGSQVAVGKGAVDLGAVSSLKVGGVIDRSQDLKLILTRTAQGLIAVSTQCTHAGCHSSFASDASELACSCHGARFDSVGTRTGGPARNPLSIYPIKLKAGHVIVNTDKITQRSSVQTKDFLKV
jgi:cytochrome b6-f complex iron-sulfur subunit